MPEQNTIDPQQLIADIAKALVDKPEEVHVDAVEEDGGTVLELSVADGDIGKVIGKQGRTVRSMRTILSAASMKLHKRYTLEILEEDEEDEEDATHGSGDDGPRSQGASQGE